jgi:molecular chaperone GrpE
MAEQNENVSGEGAAEQPANDIPAEEQLAEGEVSSDELDAELADLVSGAISKEAELLADLQRLQAEYVNYKLRVERDRDVSRNNAIAEVLRAFLPALDDLSRAEAHGDLDGSPFAAVASKLRTAGEKYGLRAFGEKGDKFDPEFHEALIQTPSSEVSENTIADVVEPGYQLGDRVIRVAKVAVFIPAEG